MLDSVFTILKISVIIGLSAVFMIAISNLLMLITSIVFGNVIGEILGLVSMFLPFNASVVFGAIGSSTVAILSFLIAKKIFDLTSWSISSIS